MANTSARNLRKRATLAERTLWQLLRKRQRFGYRFRRQHPVGPFIVDFVCLERRAILEVDGDVHEAVQRIQRDLERAARLTGQRFRILRLTNAQAMTDRELTLGKIDSFLGMSADTIVHHPHPNPPPFRGREK